jgi:hypothetical protein
MASQELALGRAQKRDHTLLDARSPSATVRRHQHCGSSKPILMSHHPRSLRLTLDPHPLLKEPELEHFQRTEETRRYRRIEHHPAVAQVSPLAHQRSDNSRPNRYLPKIILPRNAVRWRTDCVFFDLALVLYGVGKQPVILFLDHRIALTTAFFQARPIEHRDVAACVLNQSGVLQL